MSEEREQIEAELAAATKGPWTWQGVGEHGYPQQIMANDDGLVLVAETFEGDVDRAPPNCVFIANAPSHVRYLLDANDTLRTALIEAQSWIGNQLTANAVEANKRDALYFSIREALEATQ